MPIAVDLNNLIIPKEVIRQKYFGGEAQFLKDYRINDPHTRNDQDDELFSLAAMNFNEFDIDHLTSNGLSFKESYSEDFIIHTRYNGFLWDVNWIDGNELFIWHKDAHNDKIKRALFICNNMTMDKIEEALQENPAFLSSF